MKGLLGLILCAFLLGSCTSCNVSTSSDNTVNDAVQNKSQVHSSGREDQRKLIKYIRERTVQIRTDCTPKEGVVVVGIDYPAAYYGDGRGSGTVVRSTKHGSYIFTVSHVVRMQNLEEEKYFDCKYYVILDKSIDKSGKKIEAEIVVDSVGYDIAVLRIDQDLGLSTEVELNPFTGETVWAAGYPRVRASGRGSVMLSITNGTLATIDVKWGSATVYRFTAQSYFGSSGGGLWSVDGKLIGVISNLAGFESNDGDTVPFEYYARPVGYIISMLKDSDFYNEVYGGSGH